jgi:DNA-binding CsgD family transcriptional regulator
LLAEGLSIGETAIRLSLPRDIVVRDVGTAVTALGVRSRLQAVALWLRREWINAPEYSIT